MAPGVKKNKTKKPKNERVLKSTNFQTIAYLSWQFQSHISDSFSDLLCSNWVIKIQKSVVNWDWKWWQQKLQKHIKLISHLIINWKIVEIVWIVSERLRAQIWNWKRNTFIIIRNSTKTIRPRVGNGRP